jgi:alpha-tubulin suppressor-like RCC1 family protein
VVEGTQGLSAVFAGGSFACGVNEARQLWCWSNSQFFPVERSGSDPVAPSPVRAPLDRAEVVAAGSDHLCVIDAASALWCWGDNMDGAIAIADARTNRPTEVTALPAVKAASAGFAKTCAVTEAGDVYCWGLVNDLVVGVDSRSWEPVRADFVQDVVDISSPYDSACAIHSDRTVSCWGDPMTFTTASSEPKSWRRVPDLKDVVQVSAGAGHACAVRVDDTAWCWGHNDYGQLGDGSRVDSDQPVQVRGLSGVRKIVAGSGVTFAIDGSNVVWGWGNALTGLVRADATLRPETPRPVLKE